MFAAENDFTASQIRDVNVTVAGSTLIRSTVAAGGATAANNMAANVNVQNNANTSLSLSGTWRRLTRSANANTGTASSGNLYVRIS
jgi:hypothetical protein